MVESKGAKSPKSFIKDGGFGCCYCDYYCSRFGCNDNQTTPAVEKEMLLG
jgi:hypothetical protein